MKTNKAVKSRFRVTKGKKLKRKSPYRSHLLTKKTSKRKRRLKSVKLVAKGHAKTYLRMMSM